MITIIVNLCIFIVVIASLIIWFKTKDKNNKYLKKLYKIRFVIGIIVLITSLILDVVLDRYGLFGNIFGLNITREYYDASFVIGYLISRYLTIYLLIRKWVK